MHYDRENPHLMSDALNDLLAKQEITETLYLYCRAMDRNDRQLGKRVWHPDGLADYSPAFKGTGADFVDFVCGVHEIKMDTHSHQISNIFILVEGQTAASEAYVLCAHRFREHDQIKETNVRGRYLDNWTYRKNRWAIASRLYVEDFSDVHDVSDTSGPTPARRTPADPSYVTLRGL